MGKAEPVLITVLRHGEVEGRAQVLRGVGNEVLSQQGWVQMQRILTKVSDTPFDVVASSPLPRCYQFAAAYAAQKRLSLQQISAFRELDFGIWEGFTPAEAEKRNPEKYLAFRDSLGEHAPPEGESLNQLRMRIAQGWHNWLATECGNHRLLVTHAGVMRALLMELFGFTPTQAFQIALPEAACLRISHLQGKKPFLLSLN